MRNMIKKTPSGKRYIFSVLSAVHCFMVATPTVTENFKELRHERNMTF